MRGESFLVCQHLDNKSPHQRSRSCAASADWVNAVLPLEINYAGRDQIFFGPGYPFQDDMCD